MRLVVDTNVLVSAFLWQGTPGRLIELAAEAEIELFTSRALIDELSEVLHRQKLAKQVEATGLTAAQMHSSTIKAFPSSRPPKLFSVLLPTEEQPPRKAGIG